MSIDNRINKYEFHHGYTNFDVTSNNETKIVGVWYN